MSKQITIEETLEMVANVPQSVPEKVAEKIIAKATKDSVQNIGGFPITDPMLVQDRLNEAKAKRANAIFTFIKDKDTLKDRLAHHLGIDKYLAIVPTTYWKNICDRHNLETIHPDLQGRLQVNTKVPYELTEKAKRYWDIASCIFGVLGFVFGVAFVIMALPLPPPRPVNSGLPSLSSMAYITLAFGFLSWLTHYNGKRLGKKAVRNHLRKTPYATLVRDMFTPTNDYRWSTGAAAQLILPSPPPDVVLLLRKLRDHSETFTVTADPRALQFNPSVHDLYLRGHAIEKDRIAQELDPIITIAHNNATAILAQFGDFKWEKDVIEDIMSSLPLSI